MIRLQQNGETKAHLLEPINLLLEILFFLLSSSKTLLQQTNNVVLLSLYKKNRKKKKKKKKVTTFSAQTVGAISLALHRGSFYFHSSGSSARSAALSSWAAGRHFFVLWRRRAQRIKLGSRHIQELKHATPSSRRRTSRRRSFFLFSNATSKRSCKKNKKRKLTHTTSKNQGT
jgi:hypothetical protein